MDKSFAKIHEILGNFPSSRSVIRHSVPGKSLGLELAVRTLLSADTKRASLVSGFPVSTPAGYLTETDGPVGLAFIAAVLNYDAWDLRLFSESVHHRVLRAAICSFNMEIPIDEVFTPRASELLFSVERPGPSDIELAAGANQYMYHDLRGRPLKGVVDDSLTLAFHDYKRLRALHCKTIAIGDGGNEIGMGNLDSPSVHALASEDEPLVKTHCGTEVDVLILSPVSNWGAYAFALAVAAHRVPEYYRYLDPDAYERCIESTVRAGAVDGITKHQVATNDGIDESTNRIILEQLFAAFQTD